MNSKLETEKVFRDPLYVYVRVNKKIIDDLIKTIEFQRLRRIKQLSGVNNVFHCAEHTRFAHSLGTYEVARQATIKVKDIREQFSEDMKTYLIVAALLHDIGHGPFSHTFESISSVHHEQQGVNIILGDTEVNKVLKSYNPSLPTTIVSILSKDGTYPIIESLISGEIDFDRLDYMNRDSFSLGVNYGQVDLDRIFVALKIKNNIICFKESLVHIVEQYFLSRFNMYWQVYYHPKARSFEMLLMKFFKRISDLNSNKFNFNTDVNLLTNFLGDNNNIRSFLRLDDVYIGNLLNIFQDSNDEILSDLSKRLMNRKLFKSVEYSENEYNEILQDLKEQSMDPCYYLDKVTISTKPGNGHDLHVLKNNGDIVPFIDYSERTSLIYKNNKKEVTRIYYGTIE